MLNETWKDQHARLLRSHRRLQRALADRSEPDDIDYDTLDVLYHFCCDALNLRDRINYDQPQHRISASALFKSSKALSACGDIANGSKHFEADPKRSNTPGGPAGTAQTTYKINTGEYGEYDALDLAADAVADWERWLKHQYLLKP